MLSASASGTTAGAGAYPKLAATEVSAPRFLAMDLNVAARVQVLGREAIENSSSTNLAELLEKDLNVVMRSTSGSASGAQVAFRGYGENSGQRVLVLLDGHRLNPADLGGVDWLSVPLVLVEQVEVVRGAQSAYYGNNASSGVIKITTRKPSESFEGVLSGSVGSFGSHHVTGGVSGRESRVGYAVHFEHNETEGYRDNSGFESDGVGVSLDYMFSEATNIYLSTSAVKRRTELPGPLTEAQYREDPRQSNTPNDFSDSHAIYIRSGVSHRVDDSWVLALSGGYTDRSIASDFSGFIFEQEYALWSVTPSATYEQDSVILTGGLDWLRDDIDVGQINLKRSRLAGYVSGQYEMTPEWIFSAAARIEGFETKARNPSGGDAMSDREYAWSVGVVRLFDSTRLYGSVRRLYRVPAVDEIANLFPVPAFNPDLVLETGYGVEFGLDHAFERATVGLSVFWQELDDEIAYDPTQWQNMNLNSTRRIGAEAYFQVELTPTLDLRVDYAWVFAKLRGGDDHGKRVPLVPAHNVSLNLDWRPLDEWLLRLGVRYTDSFYAAGDFSNSAEKLDGRILTDISARYHLNKNVELFAAIDNLTDEKYVSYAVSNGAGMVTAYYPGGGRSAKAGITFRF